MKRTHWMLAVLACCWLVGCQNEQASAPKTVKKPALKVEPTTVTASNEDATSPVTNVAGVPETDDEQNFNPAPIQPDPNFNSEYGDPQGVAANDDQVPLEPKEPVIADIPVDFTPEEVISTFLKALCAGDEITTSALLTDRAREETTKQGLAIQPIGSTSAKYEVGKAQYPEGQEDGAWVNTVWNEIGLDNQEIQFETMWALRRQENGWRIIGMAARVNPESPSRFFNFEEPKELVEELQRGQAEEEAQGSNTPTPNQPQPTLGPQP